MQQNSTKTAARRCSSALAAVFIIGMSSLSGCATRVAPRPSTNASYDAELEPFTDLPRARIGALPFPGPFTLFDAVDLQTDDLGRHAYAAGPLDIDQERERGIVYTRRAGFLDIAHIRNSADMTAYVHARAKLAIERRWNEFAFKGSEPSTYLVTLCYPEDWSRIGANERAKLIDELALRIAQRVAFDVMTWHEIITWYGYKSTIVIPENSSAFTYDDVPSHALGVQLAAKALRSGLDYDQEMSRLLDRAMLELGAVDRETLDLAVERAKGSWWDGLGKPKARLLDIGTGDGVIEPWLVEGLVEGLSDKEPIQFRVVGMDDIGGRDFTGFYLVQIDPNVLEGFDVRGVIGSDHEYVNPDTDFPLLITDISQKLDIGPDAGPPALAIESTPESETQPQLSEEQQATTSSGQP